MGFSAAHHRFSTISTVNLEWYLVTVKARAYYHHLSFSYFSNHSVNSLDLLGNIHLFFFLHLLIHIICLMCLSLEIETGLIHSFTLILSEHGLNTKSVYYTESLNATYVNSGSTWRQGNKLRTKHAHYHVIRCFWYIFKTDKSGGTEPVH